MTKVTNYQLCLYGEYSFQQLQFTSKKDQYIKIIHKTLPNQKWLQTVKINKVWISNNSVWVYTLLKKQNTIDYNYAFYTEIHTHHVHFSGLALTCYECENCIENEAYLRNHIKQCPDSSYISCLMTESKFAHHKSKYRLLHKSSLWPLTQFQTSLKSYFDWVKLS